MTDTQTIPTQLVACRPDGQVTHIDNNYTQIKEAMEGHTLDFLQFSETGGFFVDDEALLTGEPLNVPASFVAGRPLYGVVVLAHAQPDGEGETRPPVFMDVQMLTMMAERWHSVYMGIVITGTGNPFTYGSTDDLMAPIILTGDEADTFLGLRDEGE